MLLMVWDSVKVSRSARGGAADEMPKPPPSPTPYRPVEETLPLAAKHSPPAPPAAVLSKIELWRISSEPAATEMPPPHASPPSPPSVVSPALYTRPSPPAPPYAPLPETVLWLTRTAPPAT